MTKNQDTCMDCRALCAACCIAPSISSAIPGMPDGKPAGVPCVQLDEQWRCKLFGKAERPAVCLRLRPQFEMCLSEVEVRNLPQCLPNNPLQVIA
jgi:uncharacterized protein